MRTTRENKLPGSDGREETPSEGSERKEGVLGGKEKRESEDEWEWEEARHATQRRRGTGCDATRDVVKAEPLWEGQGRIRAKKKNEWGRAEVMGKEIKERMSVKPTIKCTVVPHLSYFDSHKPSTGVSSESPLCSF